MSAELARLLRVDPLADAESITGKSYKEDDATMRLGFGLHMAHAQAKEQAAKSARDSYFAMNLAETLALYADMGFDEILCEEFAGTSYDGETAPAETYRILWRDGILITLESYLGDLRNCSKAYYNIAIRDRSDLWGRTSSGRLHDGDIWVGDHDAREGIRTNLTRLAEIGDFLPVWVESPFLWLVTYAEQRVEGYDYRAINADRISRLPVHVQAAIGGAS